MTFNNFGPDDVAGANTRPHKDQVAFLDQSLEDLPNQRPQRTIVSEDRLIHIEENIHDILDEHTARWTRLRPTGLVRAVARGGAPDRRSPVILGA
jgi:hypothetical protein